MPADLSLAFPKRLYAIGALKKAVKAFKEDADLAVDKNEDGFTVTGKVHDAEALEELRDELCNAALFYTIEGRQKW